MEFPDPKQFIGRNRRLLYEWQTLDGGLKSNADLSYTILRTNASGLPVEYIVTFRQRSICGVENMQGLNQAGVENPPVFADEFKMKISLPPDYPCIDAQPEFRFLTVDEQGRPIPHPWHPNIRYFGEFAGRVCLNALDTYSDLLWCVKRISKYLSYELYHAFQEPPYPEDFKVAEWVLKQGEPHDWTVF